MMWLAYLSMVLLMVVGILLMIIILLQRGRGGGLAGAFGGAGGQSAFGTRAGDVFTKITAIMAIIWVFLAGVSRFALEPAATQYAQSFTSESELEKLEKEQEKVPNLESKRRREKRAGIPQSPQHGNGTPRPPRKKRRRPTRLRKLEVRNPNRNRRRNRRRNPSGGIEDGSQDRGERTVLRSRSSQKPRRVASGNFRIVCWRN